jgi:glycosyltransferase involved in cell wall biosynthesis
MKPLIVLQGPVATRSGYGNHTRDLAISLINANKYDIQIVSLPWGNTPQNALELNNPIHQLIAQHIATQHINKQPDVFIQVSVPNEFGLQPNGQPLPNGQKIGKYNIGVTAGIETTHVPHDFLLGCNRMDLVITTSNHSKKSFIDSVYDKVDEQTKQKTGDLKLETPIEVLFEGADLDVYHKTTDIHDTVIDELSSIKNKFCYLFVGHWLKGDLGHDRKDIGMMIKTFCETFKKKARHNRPALILKTSSATFSIIDRDQMFKKIQTIIAPYGNSIPDIYLLHGDLSDQEMNSLYNHSKIKAMISFTKGEGFGRPLLEFSISGKPVIATNWSGHTDFLKYSPLLPGTLGEIHSSAADRFLIKGSQWFTADYAFASRMLKDITENYKNYLPDARKQAAFSKQEFNLHKMSKVFCELVDKGLEGVPQQTALKLPKLKKVENNPPVLKLPKLKKVEI